MILRDLRRRADNDSSRQMESKQAILDYGIEGGVLWRLAIDLHSPVLRQDSFGLKDNAAAAVGVADAKASGLIYSVAGDLPTIGHCTASLFC